MLFLGLDVGTSAVRAIVIDETSRIVAKSRVELAAAQEDPDTRGGLQQDPALWWQACQQAISALDRQISLPTITRLAIDGTSATTLLCNRQGVPLTPALMYNDSRAEHQARFISAIAPSGHICASPTSALAKALWLYQGLSDRRQTSDSLVLHQADWLSGKFTGRFGVSDYNNCLKLGYDVESCKWPTWLRQLGLASDCLPKVVAPGSDLGVVDAEVADALHLSRDCHVVAGTTDSTASILAAGRLAHGDAVTTLGSTLVVKILTRHAINAANEGVYSHFYFGHFLAGGASNSGGAVLRHFFSQADIERLSLQIDPDSDCDLDYYPLLRPGERFPIADATLAPRLTPRPEQDSEFLHGLMLGIAKIEKLGYDQLQKLGAPYPKRVVTMGGGANSEVWRRIRQRILKVPVHNLRHCESALGAAILAKSKGAP